MAEIILEPTVQSKVIPLSIRLNDTDTSLTSQLVTNRQFSTADTDAWFSFTLEGLAATTGTFDLALINLHDKSVFNHTDKVFNTNPFYYKLDSGADELTNEIRHAGKWVGQLVVTLANGDSATRKFIFGIEGHILDGTVVQTILLEDYNALIASIESAKDELTQYNIDYSTLISTVESQEAARVQAELTREQTFNALVDGEIIAQNVATELQNIEATYAPRLLSAEQQLAETTTKEAFYQSDIIEKINRLKIYDDMYYMRKSGTTDVSIIFKRNDDLIVWEMNRNAYDDFKQLGLCYAAIAKPTEKFSEAKAFTPVQWTEVLSSDPYRYTNTVGDKISVTFTGTGVDFRHIKTKNGGIWRYTVQETGDTIDVSTYSATMLTKYVKPLFRNLPLGTYTVIGEFIGADTSTVAPARGWIDYINTFDIYIEDTGSDQFRVEKVDDLLVGFSNKELALQFRPLNSGLAPVYTPMHSGVGTAFDREEMKILASGVQLTNIASTLVSNKIYPCNEITFVQKMRAKHPNHTQDSVNFDISHTFKENGNVEVIGKLITLEHLEVLELFTFMLPAYTGVVDKVLTSKGNLYPSTATDRSITDTSNKDGKTTSSYAFLSDANDYIIAGRINDTKETMLLDVPFNEELYNSTWIQHRDAYIQKVYTYAMRAGTLNVGDIVRFSQTFNCAKINNINNLI